MMRAIIITILSVLITTTANADNEKPSSSKMTAFVGGQIIDGTGAPAFYDGVVLVEGNIIKAIGKVGDFALPENVTIIDTNGKTVMPGLIDVHVHYDIVGHADYTHWFDTYPKRMRSDIFPAAGASMLDAGVTSVRDLGGDVENVFWLKQQVNEGKIRAPRTFIAGPFLRKTLTSYVDKGYKDTWTIDGASDAREKVRLLHQMGVDLIKTQDEALSHEELSAIYDEAHKLGLRVASHIYSQAGVRAALKAGMGAYDTIEHIGDGEALRYDDDIVDMIVNQQVAMAPTIIALEGVQMIVDNLELTDDPRWSQYLPDDVYQDIRRSYRDADLSEHPIFKRAAQDRAGRFAKLRQLDEAGAIFAISSDSGTRGNPHHDAMWREMVLTQKVLGKTSMDVIVAATKINAKILGQSETLGTLEVGKLADIIVIDGDPINYLSDMRRVELVMKDGVVQR
jgi:imidazolonepropionase-like amidohydrolase